MANFLPKTGGVESVIAQLTVFRDNAASLFQFDRDVIDQPA